MILETVSKGFETTAFVSIVTVLNVFNILKPLPSEGSFHLRKDKNAIKETGIFLAILGESLA
jgi:hypothetical protein